LARRSREAVLTSADRSNLRRVCIDLAEKGADETGFVAVPRLLNLFSAEVHVRPLLVEGMLASLPPDGVGHTRERWAVLVDSESHSISAEAVASETRSRPLPARVRNTIAHELAHSLAFRTTEFDFQLSKTKPDGKPSDEYVREIEKETEKLSPFLLLPTSALARLLAGRNEPLDATELVGFARAMGVSRDVLISRLDTLSRGGVPNLRERAGLYRLGIGMGEWQSDGTASLSNWPIFHNYERSLLPTFVAELVGGRRRSISAADIGVGGDFILLGGHRTHAIFETTTGLDPLPRQERIQVRLTVEATSSRPGTRFMFAAAGHPVRG
jgi:hypothetical protein